MRGKHLGLSMLYSFMIGAQISAWISLLSTGLSWLLRRWRGEAAAPAPGWVGWGWMLPCVVVGSVAGYSGGVWLTNLLMGLREPLPWELPGGRAAVSVVFALVMSLLATGIFYSMFRVNALRLAQAQAQRQAAEAQLTLLQSQLEPHMLFNTLAHLRVLIKLRPDEAQRMLDRLIDYLRATLQASRATEHALAAEFDRLADYLALMSLRMGERLRVQLDLPEDLARLNVPPLLLQPLVENAIKHGLEPHVDGGTLRVGARRLGDRLVLEVADSGVGLAQATALPGTGFGLAQVRERLAQRYGGTGRFELLPQPGGGSIARIEIPA
ncbi:MAG: histidine kinase [Pelomonas sp.]|nr:histidine kinase [Roseateles sp.]